KKVIEYKIKSSVPSIDKNDSRVQAIINYLQNNLFGTGIRRSALTEDEFKDILRKFALIQ
ncbi:MAG: hypothetical protein ACFFD2_03175, partial [Promethearchaeota archaeon]